MMTLIGHLHTFGGRFLTGKSLPMTGILMGTLFFSASLTPSLLPRTPFTQGLVSGFSLAAGYGVGVGALWLWSYLGLPALPFRFRHRVGLGAFAACAAIAVAFLWQASEWQNAIRTLMQLEPLDSAQPFRVGLIALLVFIALILLARLFRQTFDFLSRKLRRFVPVRVSHAVGFVIAVILFWSIANGVLFRSGLRMADVSFQRFDALMEPDVEKPADPGKTGSKESLIPWADLGRTGRKYVSTGPSRDEIAGFTGAAALEPVRVYVGLNAAATTAARATLALEELKRVKAFDRSVLVIVTPTGTGWIDPSAMDTLEYLHGGDIASVAVQYSYLSSWLSLLVEPDYGAKSARALFLAVYNHWTGLPANARPKLYLHGLSLGALNSDLSADMFDIVADPFQGALWSGPPFQSNTWRTITQDRTPGSPAWLPRFRDGSVIRFTNQRNALPIPGAAWGPLRIVYLQYASDPVVFFDPQILFRNPEWIAEPRGPDVSKSLRWFPIVTMLQLAVDIAAATTAPRGYGHVYAPEHYIDAWVEVTGVDWPADRIARLKSRFAGRQAPVGH